MDQTLLNSGGKMNSHPQLRIKNGMPEFVLAYEDECDGQPAIAITQQDLRELQLAKAAIRAGVDMLLDHTGHAPEDICKIIIDGAFGSYINITSAVTVGMLPALPLDRFEQVGNAADIGARLVLASQSHRAESQELEHKISYFELASVQQFAQVISRSTYLGTL